MKARNLLSRLTATTIALLALGCVLVARSPNLLVSPEPATPNISLQDVEVWVEGPWAYTDDPRDSTRIALIAPNPKSIGHLAPAVAHRTGDLKLDADSVLEIANLAHLPQPCSTCSMVVAPQPKVLKQKLTDVLNAKKGWYVITLPKPDFYEEAVGQESKIGSVWWDDCRPNCITSSVRQSHTTQIILHYSVNALQGFTVNKTKLDFQDRHTVNIFMTPKGEIDDCDSGARATFKELVALFSLQLYIDLPVSSGHYPSDDDPGTPNCLDSDPQKPANNVAGSLADALERLRDYILEPAPGLASRARAAWNQLNQARNLVPSGDLPTFNENMAGLDQFLRSAEEAKKTTPDSPATMRALLSLKAVSQSIPRHNGSGACRNPLLKLNPV
jgi:hypothetical protein